MVWWGWRVRGLAAKAVETTAPAADCDVASILVRVSEQPKNSGILRVAWNKNDCFTVLHCVSEGMAGLNSVAALKQKH